MSQSFEGFRLCLCCLGAHPTVWAQIRSSAITCLQCGHTGSLAHCSALHSWNKGMCLPLSSFGGRPFSQAAEGQEDTWLPSSSSQLHRTTLSITRMDWAVKGQSLACGDLEMPICFPCPWTDAVCACICYKVLVKNSTFSGRKADSEWISSGTGIRVISAVTVISLGDCHVPEVA